MRAMTRGPRRGRVRTAAVALASGAGLALGLGACGDSEDKSDDRAAAGSTAPATTPLTGAPGSSATGDDVPRGDDSTGGLTPDGGTTSTVPGRSPDADRRRGSRKRSRGRDDRGSIRRDRDDRRSPSRDSGASAKVRFIDQGDEICRRFRSAQRELGGEPNDRSGRVRYYARLADLVSDSVNAFRAHPIPADGREDVVTYLSALEANVDLLRRLSAAAERNDPSQLDLARQIRRNSARAGSHARAYGFHVCGSRS